MTHHEHPDAALIRRGYEAFSNGDMATLESLMTSDCTHHVPGESRISGHYKGRDNVLGGYYRSLAELTEGTFRVELKGVFVDGRGHAITTHRFHADRGDRGIEMDGGLFFTLVGGKISDIDECVADIVESDSFWGTG
ncbi:MULTISPECIES: nuclear transport factor 2 family protein [unclassified Streptomyces]|uniref:nuclear transport factor 2 family protein n=1 Tax=unclassified Streptomyces TaxID=2593676 RepID=UPI0006F55E84|nr:MULTISPECIES: nuclear transport factor 2 family protein [unclassified Streptomyces]KQX49326.1 SnoaL-like polyketide cyclase [Streptomyces sp. Root1304]KRA78944.1 SnoaL-like polyketide cyclase [Streptomyces sp. Root66D1]